MIFNFNTLNTFPKVLNFWKGIADYLRSPTYVAMCKKTI